MILPRRDVLALTGAAGLWTLFGCNKAGAGASDGDMTIGAANAPATLIEYASSTCPHCAEFHRTVWDQLKANYIDTGKVRFTFREFPTPPAQVAVAEFQVARCGGATPDQYLARVGVFFNQQQQILGQGATMETVRQHLVQIGQEAGLSEDQVMACINDEHGAERIRQTVSDGERQFDIQGTPTLILNNRKLEDPSAVTYAGLSRLIDAAIAGH